MMLYRYPPISDYGLIGNGHTAALVSSGGGIDWWCPERFDANAAFSRLLDWDNGGHFSIYASGSKEFSYLPDTNILRTVYRTATGVLNMLTFMPYHSDEIIRILKCEKGNIDFFVDLKFTGISEPGTIKKENNFGWENKQINLLSSSEISGKAFSLSAGEDAVFILNTGTHRTTDEIKEYAFQQFKKTKAFWNEWIGKCNYNGYAKDLVKRSLFCLKLLQYKDTGALVAAPTTSLPEYPGGNRNWDYRFSWIRDGVFIVMAFETLGFEEESDNFRRWLTETIYKHRSESLQMLYAVDCEKGKKEEILEWEGYRGSKPVRTGNNAAVQRQIDTYGEAMLCYHRADKIFEGPLRKKAWEVIKYLLGDLEKIWKKPDAGIWEVQEDEEQFLYSKAVTYLAFDHGVSISENYNLNGPVEKWRQIAKEALELVSENFRTDIDAFSASIGQKDIDGANLLFAILGIYDYRDERMVRTVEKIREDLEVHKMIFRNLNFKNFDIPEGAFSPVTFWMCQVEARQGNIDKAIDRFEHLVNFNGSTGLMSEESDPVTGEMWGNYPQALTHLSLILAAWAINDILEA
jgi:GH15 family glucan-1,4-alpha-glucosidase